LAKGIGDVNRRTKNSQGQFWERLCPARNVTPEEEEEGGGGGRGGSYICPVLHPVTSNNHKLLHVKNTCYFFNCHKHEG
jgi:hypothetical protein